MIVRLLQIPGATAAARERRLGKVRAWMEAAGWELVDYAAEAGSAAFERPDAAPPLPRWHPTLWRKGPGFSLFSVALFLAGMLIILGLASGVGGSLLVQSQSWFAGLGSEEPQEAQQGDWRMVLVDYLNLRTGPGTGNPVVEVLRQGDRVRIVSQEGSWVELSHPAQGWVDESYLSER